MKMGIDYERLGRANAFLAFHLPSSQSRLVFDGRDRLQWMDPRGRLSGPARVPDPPDPANRRYWESLALVAVEIAKGAISREQVREEYPEWVDAQWPEYPPASRRVLR